MYVRHGNGVPAFTSNKSSVQYLNVSLAKNSRIDTPSGSEQRFMLLHTLGFKFRSLLTECVLCKKEIGNVSRHADCCEGAEVIVQLDMTALKK